MKTLDEVLRGYEICTQEQSCSLCPYIESHMNGKWACSLYNDCTHDAFRYLKEYRDLKNTMNWHEEMEEIRRRFTNAPLTWDELKTMIGKPIWVEMDNVKFWTIVDNFRTICNQECLCYSKGYMCQSTYARGDWQAYRKERK